jgi:single-stranded DNA-binding protein
VVVFGTLAERTVGTLYTGDPVIAQGEFRFRAYEDAGGNTRTGTSFVASRLGPDILLADVTVPRRARPVGLRVVAGPGGRGRKVEMPPWT